MQVKHPSLKSAELNVGGVTIKSDENGVFDVSDEIGARLLGMKGYVVPRQTREQRNAYRAFKKSEAIFIAAEADFKDKKDTLNSAIVQADNGLGTPWNEGEAEEDSSQRETVPDKPPARKPSREPAKVEPEPEPEVEPEEFDEDDKEDNAVIIANLIKQHRGEPSMQWKLDDLITFAQAKGISAETGWTKAQCLQEIEEFSE